MEFESTGMHGAEVILTDAEGRTLPCLVEESLDVEGENYLLLMPLHNPVEIFSWQVSEDGEEEVLDVEEEEIDLLFPTARAVLEEQNLTLHRTALTLTVVGEVPDPEDEDCFTLEITDEEVPDLESEEFQILARFFYEEEEYTICTPIEPLLFFAHCSADGEVELVSPEEFQRIRPQLEDRLLDVLEDD